MNLLPWLGDFEIPVFAYFVFLTWAGVVVLILAKTGPRTKKAAAVLAWGVMALVFTQDGYMVVQRLPEAPYWFSLLIGGIVPACAPGLIVYGFTRTSYREMAEKFIFEPPYLVEKRANLDHEASMKIAFGNDRENVFTGIDGDHLLLPEDFPMQEVPSALEKQFQYFKKKDPKRLERVAGK